MDEAEWLVCEEPRPMLEYLRGKASDRKLRLFACGCCRRLWDLLPSDLNRQAVQAIEEYPDTVSGELYPEGVFSHPVLGEALVASSSQEILWNCGLVEPTGTFDLVALLEAVRRSHGYVLDRSLAYRAVKSLGRSFYKSTPLKCAVSVALRAAGAKGEGGTRAEAAEQAALLRDVLGNPFRPVSLDPTWLTPTVVGLAQAAYDERILPAGTLDADRLAILADALEDASCTDTAILSHLRGTGPHVRGCWVVDCLLKKG